MLNAVMANNVEGILFGERGQQQKAKTTDNSSDERYSATTVLVSSYVCMDPSRRYYDARGAIVPDALAELVKGKEDSVIGMFKWRRNSKLAVGLREAAVYESLQLLQRTANAKDHILAIFTGSNDEPAISQFDFAFFNRPNQSTPFCKVPTVIANLVESAQIQHQWFAPATPSFSHLSGDRLTARLQKLSTRYVQDHASCLDDSLDILKVKKRSRVLPVYGPRLTSAYNLRLQDAAQTLMDSEEELRRLRAKRVGPGTPHDISPSHLVPVSLSPTLPVSGGVGAQVRNPSPDRRMHTDPFQRSHSPSDILNDLDLL
ncbi:hypothetical protein HDU90_002806 [Geranomyces variabilis]|nr:hypothetical protein HDU90_002806 [Geranomyces variabilis]